MSFTPLPLSLLSAPQPRRHSGFGRGLGLPALALCLGAGALLFSPAQAQALEEVTLTYGTLPLKTIPVTDLEQFAITGEPSAEIQSLLDAAKIDSATAQAVIGREIEVDGELLSQVAQTFIGEALLKQVATAISQTDSSTPSWQDLRTATLSALADNQISTLEVLQNFEGASITIDTEQLGAVATTVQRSVKDIQSIIEILRSREA